MTLQVRSGILGIPGFELLGTCQASCNRSCWVLHKRVRDIALVFGISGNFVDGGLRGIPKAKRKCAALDGL